MGNLKHYFNVYRLFVSTSTQVQASFRVSFILLVLMDLFFFFSTLASVEFIYNHITAIGPWNREQLLFFITFMLTLDSLHMMIFSHNFWQLSVYIRTGELDFILLKPLSSIFNCFFREFRSSALVTLPIAIGLMINYGISLSLGALDWFMIPFFLILSLSLLVLIEFILSTAMFWMIEGTGINFLRMQLQQLARWPNFIYSGITQKVLTIVIPVLLVGSAPIHFFYDKSKWQLPVLMLIAIIILYFILHYIWKKALLSYESASS